MWEENLRLGLPSPRRSHVQHLVPAAGNRSGRLLIEARLYCTIWTRRRSLRALYMVIAESWRASRTRPWMGLLCEGLQNVLPDRGTPDCAHRGDPRCRATEILAASSQHRIGTGCATTALRSSRNLRERRENFDRRHQFDRPCQQPDRDSSSSQLFAPALSSDNEGRLPYASARCGTLSHQPSTGLSLRSRTPLRGPGDRSVRSKYSQNEALLSYQRR